MSTSPKFILGHSTLLISVRKLTQSQVVHPTTQLFLLLLQIYTLSLSSVVSTMSGFLVLLEFSFTHKFSYM